MRRSLGTAVFSGMLGVTIFGIMFTPVFFYLIDTVSESHVFASPRVRRVGLIALMIVTGIAFPPMLLIYLWRATRRRPTGAAKPVPHPELSPAAESESESLDLVEQE